MVVLYSRLNSDSLKLILIQDGSNTISVVVVTTLKEDIREDKVPKRLAKIRDMFTYQKIKHRTQYPDAHLTVKTWVLNPELPFAAQL